MSAEERTDFAVRSQNLNSLCVQQTPRISLCLCVLFFFGIASVEIVSHVLGSTTRRVIDDNHMVKPSTFLFYILKKITDELWNVVG